MLELSRIKIDGGTQTRVELNQSTVSEYAEAMRDGAQFPPVIVYFDDSDYWLADGFHRYFAAKQAGLEQIFEERIPGTKRQAILHSLGANAAHGLRRSNADKRRAVETMLADPEWAAWSNEAIAKACCVSPPLVADVRKSISKNLEIEPPRTVTRNGTTYQQNTASIGKPQAQPAAVETVREQPAHPVIIKESSEPMPEPEGASEIEELRDKFSELGQVLKETLADNESLVRTFESDDKVAAALAEASRYREQNRILESRITGLMNERNEAIRLLKSWKWRAEKAESALSRNGS